MAERTQVEKTKSRRTQEDAPAETKTETDAEKVAKLKADTDSLLDEIDTILNEESVDMVEGFRQKGGE